MDTTGNFLTTLRNAELAGHATVVTPLTKLNRAIAEVLVNAGYLQSAQVEDGRLHLSFPEPVKAHHYQRISKPGRHLYTDHRHIPTIMNGRGLAILSTPLGLLSGKDARKQKVGGELICQVY